MTTIVLFFILSIALLLLAILLLWFVPHLLQQQEERAAQEARRLRELLSDMLGEQEAVALRQAQLGTSLSYLQDQIEQLTTSWPTTVDDLLSMPNDHKSQQALEDLSERILGLQQQLDVWMQHRSTRQPISQRDNESWANLMGLLSAMQERLGQIERARQRHAQQPGTATSAAANHGWQNLDDAELESRLRTIADDLVALRWRLQRTMQPAGSGASTVASEQLRSRELNGNGQGATLRSPTLRSH